MVATWSDRPGPFRVSRLGLALIKGTRHLEHDRLELDGHGPVGDRHFCLVDERRSRVLRTVENPRLLAVEATGGTGSLSCRFPDDAEVVEALPNRDDTRRRSDHRLSADYWGRRVALELLDGPWSAAFSDYLGHPVRLARARVRGAVVYGASVTVFTTATLEQIDRRLSELAPDELSESRDGLAARFRSTVVLSGDGGGPDAELGWLGRRLRIGSAVLQMRAPVLRCAVIDLDPLTGSRNRPVLQAVGARPGHTPVAGADATVVQPGLVTVGDVAELIS